jgi:hypothetical protein
MSGDDEDHFADLYRCSSKARVSAAAMSFLDQEANCAEFGEESEESGTELTEEPG